MERTQSIPIMRGNGKDSKSIPKMRGNGKDSKSIPIHER